MNRRFAIVALITLAWPFQQARAQDQPSLSMVADAANGHRGVLRLYDALADHELEEALRSGLPLRLRFRVELWKDEFIDDQLGAEEWAMLVTYDPLSELYIVRNRNNPGAARAYTDYRAMRGAVETSYPVALRPNGRGKFYYTASVDIETLSLSDLDELERWLKGAGDRSIPSALGQGARRLFMRVLSLPERRFEARSERFELP